MLNLKARILKFHADWALKFEIEFSVEFIAKRLPGGILPDSKVFFALNLCFCADNSYRFDHIF